MARKLTIAAHHVTGIELSDIRIVGEDTEDEFACRDFTITFEDGGEQKITLFAEQGAYELKIVS